MKRKEKQIQAPVTVETMKKFTRFGKQKQRVILQNVLNGKEIQGGRRVVEIDGVRIVLVFTGAGWIIVKITGRLPHRNPDDNPEWKPILNDMIQNGYTPKRVATKDAVLIELTSKVDKDTRLTLAI